MNLAQHTLIFAVRVYRFAVSPLQMVLFGPLARCRYEPTCSEYAMEAVRQHGALKGSWLALNRVCRCHPWGACGWDPVPPAEPAHGTRDRNFASHAHPCPHHHG